MPTSAAVDYSARLLDNKTLVARVLKSEELFNSLSLFRDVSLASVQQHIARCNGQIFKPGEVILTPQQENKQMYVILFGSVGVHLDTVESNPLILLGSGECVGEMSVFDGKNPSAYVVAQETTEMLVINRENLWAMINESHGVSRNLLYLLSRRIRTGNAAVVDSKQMQKQSERHANIDALTGLYNRRWLDSFFARIAMRESQEPVMMSIVLVDVDHFKRFNDEYGHLAGDQVLRTVADALRESVRPQDFVVRYGGEEFMLLLPRTRVPDASRVAERVRKTIAQTAINLNGNALPSMTISLGVAELGPHGSIETAIEHADAALYRAKGAGRNQVCYHQAPAG